MSRNVVTTELVADQPVVIVLHHDQFLAHAVIQSLAKEKVHIESYTIDELLQSRDIQQRLDDAYKIAWVTGVEHYLENYQNVELTDSFLVPFQDKLTILMPVITAFTEQVPGELPYAAKVFETQRAAILFHNSYLPNATFLFGQDLVSAKLETSFLYLITQNINQGILYSTHSHVHPQSVENFVHRVLRYFLQPQRASVLIRGNSVNNSDISKDIKQLYQSYHFTPLTLQEVFVYSEPTLPFSVVENFVTDDVRPLVAEFTQSLPSPSAPQKISTWKRLFGSLTIPPSSDYGTEVQPQLVTSNMQPEYEEIAPSKPQENIEKQITQNTKAHEAQAPAAVVETPPEDLPETAITVDRPQVEENYDLNREINQLFSKTHVSHKKTQTSRIQEKKKTITKKTKKRTAFFYGGLAFTGMGLGILCLSAVFIISLRMLKSSVADFLVQKVNAEEASVPDTGQVDRIKRLRSIVSVQADTYSLILNLPALEDAQRLAELSTNIATVTNHSAEADKQAEMLYLQIIGSDSGDVIATAANLSDKALAAYETLTSLNDELTSTSLPLTDSPELSQSLKEYEKDLAARRTGIQTLQQFSPLLTDLLGINQKRTYAVILQNNQELRPTGGFIEAVAIITFDKGAITSSRIYSGDEIDKNLNGSVVPPDEIKRYLTEEDWNFIDSNWNPNFPDAANQISWFLDKSLGVSVDGVATIDLYGLSTILEKTGPLDMPQYNEVLTHKNLLDQFEFHSEISLVEKKVDYRTEVFEAFIKKITSLSPEKAIPLFSALQENMSTQHMLISFKNADELNTVKSLGWSGALLQPNCPSQLSAPICVIDTVAQVEANVGINKANYHLKRTIEQMVSLEATQAAHLRKITFENTAQNDSWPKGPYRVFTRLYLPSSAIPGPIKVNNEVLPALDVSVQEENSRKVVGFYVEVPVKASKTVTVEYSVPYSVGTQSFAYAFFEQQQPGSGTTPFKLIVQPNQAFKPTLIAPQATLENSSVIFTKPDNGHSFFGIKFN